MQKKYQVSIHAPVRGATQALRNSFGALVVSIHAPVRGATGLGGDGFQNKYSFNPRAREGRDPLPLCRRPGVLVFQSTRP